MNYIDELRFSVKYPFTELAKDIVKNANIDFRSLDPVFIDRARQRIMQDIKGRPELNIQTKMSSVLMTELVSYPIAKVLVALSKSSFLKKKFADSEASLFRKFAQNEDDDIISKLASDLGINLDDNKVDLHSYLSFIPSDEAYKLYYKEVSKGFVSLDRDSLIEILTSAYKSSLEKSLDEYPKDLEFMKKHLKGLILERRNIEYKGSIKAGAFPPCIKAILADAAAGQHLGHSARFVIATFLADIGLEKKKIVDVFRNQPNFNEKLTLYHIEYIMGERGSGRKKICPSCEKMKSYGLCINPDDLCKRVNNPLLYYRIKVRRTGRGMAVGEEGGSSGMAVGRAEERHSNV